MAAAWTTIAATAADLADSAAARRIEALDGRVERDERDERGRITGVDLASKWVTDDDLALLGELEQLRRIRLDYSWISDLGMKRLTYLLKVREIGLSYCDYLTDGAVAAIKDWKELEVLDLEGTDVTSRSFEHIAGMTRLRVLRVGHSRVEDEGFENLAPLERLEELSIGGNKMSGRALPLLKLLPALRRLDLGGRQRTDSGMWSVALSDFNLDALAELTDLESLDLRDLPIGDNGVARLTSLVRLRELNLSGTEVGAEGLAALAKLPRLETLRLWRAEAVDDRAAEALAAFDGLEALDLTETSITGAGLRRLVGLGSLKRLYIGGSDVEAAAAARFRESRPDVFVSWREKPRDYDHLADKAR